MLPSHSPWRCRGSDRRGGRRASAHADGCYTWNRTLTQGRSGADVRQLQIRVAGWAGYRDIVENDGSYGPKTAAAVKRFQQAYGLRADGIAGPQTYAKLYQLQDNDCTPAHFTFTELDNGCGGSGYSGGPCRRRRPSRTRCAPCGSWRPCARASATNR
ncbi:peptidoglycan-binding domain-containing protein [Micromonospora sp. M12]